MGDGVRTKARIDEVEAARRAGPIVRAGVDLGVGSGIAISFGLWHLSTPADRASWTAPVGVVVFGLGLTALAIGAITAVLVMATAAVETDVWWRIMVIAGVTVLLFWLLVPGSSALGAIAVRGLLPVVPVLAFGLWLCFLTRSRGPVARWPRYAADLLIIAAVAAALIAVHRTDRLAAAGLLFPLGVAPAYRLWRKMGRSSRSAVRAGADVVLSVLLGTELLLLFVWAANLAHLAPGEVSLLRRILAAVGSASGFPWWSWVAVYALLAAAGLALAIWPVRLARLGGFAHRLRVVTVVGVARRVLTVAHLTLLIAVLIGVTGPVALHATVDDRLRTAYTIALRDDLEALGEQAAYQRIHDLPPSRSSTGPLADMLTKIHNISPPPPGSSDATTTERHLAAALGRLQARAAALRSTPAWRAGRPADRALADFDAGTGLRGRLRRLAELRKSADQAGHRAHQVGDLAAVVVANLVQARKPAGPELLELVAEYLSGIVENGPVKDFFTAWAERVAGVGEPPATERVVVPNPLGLELFASTALNEVREKQLLPVAPLPKESPIDASVDLANQARYLQERTGPCAGCPHPRRPGEEPHEFRPEHPIERP